LRGDVALRDEEVVESGGVDVENAVGVAADGYGSGKAGKMDIAVKLRQRGFGCGAKPEDSGKRGEEKQDKEGDAGPEKDQYPETFGPAAMAARLGWRGR
jgi:hypothetical protein